MYVRSAVGILDCVGNIGGFSGSIVLFFAALGAFFSERLFKSAIARDLYLLKHESS